MGATNNDLQMSHNVDNIYIYIYLLYLYIMNRIIYTVYTSDYRREH